MKRALHLCDTLLQNQQPWSNHEKTSKQLRLRGFVQNSRPVLFKRVKVIKDKDGETYRWEES